MYNLKSLPIKKEKKNQISFNSLVLTRADAIQQDCKILLLIL